MPSFEMPRGSELAPERKPPEAYAKSLRVQSVIVGRMAAESERHEWIEKNGALFRKLMDEDADFQKLVLDEDVDGVLEALERKKMQ